MSLFLRRYLGLLLTGAIVTGVSCRERAVTAVDVHVVEVLPATQQLAVGETGKLEARVEDAVGRRLRRSIVWNSSAPAIASVTSDGEIIARAAGTATITAAVGAHSGQAQVSVAPRPVSTVEVVPAATTLPVGDSVSFRAIARASDGTELTGRNVTWSTNDARVVAIGETGWARGVGAGTAVVTATVDGVRGQATATVRSAQLIVANVRVEPAVATLGAGDTLRLRAVATTSDGTEIPGRTPTWTASNSAVASVDATGKVRGLAAGTASIRATIDNLSGEALLTVTAATIVAVDVTPASSSLGVGSQLALTATVRASDGTVVTGARTTWTSERPAVASVDSSGVVTARAMGSAIITASAGGRSGTATVFVVAPPTTISILPAAPRLFVGDTLLLTARIQDSNGVDQTGRVVVWASSDTAIAIVFPTGAVTQQARLTGRRDGTVTVSASSDGRSDQVQARIDPRAELVVTKAGPVTPVLVGDTLVFTIRVMNGGPSPATSVIVTDTLPANATFVSATGGANRTGSVLTWPAAASLAAGAGVSHTLRLTATGGTSLTNVAAARAGTFERNLADNRSAATVALRQADLVAKKTANKSVVNAADTIVFTLDISNQGTAAASAVVLTDTLPANAAFISATGSAVRSGNVLTWPTIASLSAGSSVSQTVRVRAPVGGVVTNVAAAASASGDANPADNRSSVTVGVNALADLIVRKTTTAGPIDAGLPIVYRITVSNAGPSAAATVVVRDSLPVNATFVSATPSGTLAGTLLTWPALSSLAAGDSSVYTVTVTAPATGTVRNVASATTATGEANLSNNLAAVTTSVQPADLSVLKTGPAVVAPGDTITYALTAQNGGPGRAVTVVLADTLPAGATFVSATGGPSLSGRVLEWPALQSLAAGASVNHTVRILAPASGPLENKATIRAATTDPNPANDLASVTTAVTLADLEMLKAGPSSINARDTVVYFLTVKNKGPTAAASVVVRDTLPAAATFIDATGSPTLSGNVLTWTIPSVAAADSVRFTARVQAPTTGSLTNVASAASSTKDPDLSNNLSSVSTTVVPVANLAATKSGPTQASPGQGVTYTVGVSNAGPSAAASVVLSDSLPAGFTFVSASNGGTASGRRVTWPTVPSVAAGGSLSYTVTATAAATAGAHVNVGRVTSATLDPVAANNRVTLTTTVSIANLGVTKAGPPTGTSADTLSFTITVSNAGPSTAVTVVVRDTLPANATFVSSAPAATPAGRVLTWNVASIASGGSSNFTVRMVGPAAGGSITNAANGASATFDPDLANNHATASSTITQAANLAVTMIASPAAPTTVDTVRYTITVTNLGPSPAASVVVTDTLPANATFISATGGAVPSGNVLTFPAIPSLAAGGSDVYVVRVRPTASGSLTNIAAGLSATADPVPANNKAVVTLPVTGPPPGGSAGASGPVHPEPGPR